ncbi:MAG TPA: DUF1801 domain-containing protein [Vicinamibacterales bacterium]|nr:DUF1801 domain-containing protein [Vicinamibacterales bacterium]
MVWPSYNFGAEPMAASKRKIKTVERRADPIAFIDKVKSEVKRKDSHELLAMMRDITGAPPKMWGPSIVGFGSHRYVYASGREGEMCLTGFSPRSGALVVYLGPGIENEKLMARLGKHEHGKGCLYINTLDDVDREILRKLIEYAVAEMRKRGPAK